MLRFLFFGDHPAKNQPNVLIWLNPDCYIQQKYGPHLQRMMQIEP